MTAKRMRRQARGQADTAYRNFRKEDNPMSETYTVVECARRMGIDQQTLRNLIKTKQVTFGFAFRQPSGRIHCVIPKKAFDKFMEDGISDDAT